MWETIQPYINQIVMGFFTALAPIVAAIGIVAENRSARKREFNLQKNNLKIGIINDLYDMTNKISHNDILRQVNVEGVERKVISEILQTGTSNILAAYQKENMQFLQNVIDAEMHKQEIRKALNIEISFETLIHLIEENIKQIQAELDVIDYATRSIVLSYSRNRDRDVAIKELVNMLEKKKTDPSIDKFAVYDAVDTICTEEKKQLEEIISAIVFEYSCHRKYSDISDEFEKIEKCLAESLIEIW